MQQTETKIIYHIGRMYKYPNLNKLYKLSFVHAWVFVFACGHRVTDNVFIDMIDTTTGIQVYQNKQLQLF